ncbi:MAG: AsnC family transcriptional regulator [Chromatiales bacterium]|jgi:DNA-binding Lrp family transcriptional regulator
MDLSVHIEDRDRALIQTIQGGLPLVSRPYAAVGERLGMSEGEVLARLARLIDTGVIKRLGVVVRHRELGYRANGMAVWQVPESRVRALGRWLGALPFVTLCYRRAARPPAWPYNLFTMIHGRDRGEVLARVDQIVERYGLQAMPRDVLFSLRRFKQRGACYTVGDRRRAETAPPTAPGQEARS